MWTLERGGGKSNKVRDEVRCGRSEGTGWDGLGSARLLGSSDRLVYLLGR